MWNPWHQPRPTTEQLSDMVLLPVSLQAVYNIRLEITSPQYARPHGGSISTVRPGDTIAGSVVVNVTRPTYMNDITVELSGKCNVTIGKLPGLALDNGGDSMDLFRPRQHILSAIPCQLQPGQSYRWPFATALPKTTEYALQSGINKVDRLSGLRPLPWDFEDGKHELPSSFRYGTHNDAGAKTWKSAKMMADCEVSYRLQIKINRKYMPDHHTADFPLRVVAHDSLEDRRQIFHKSMSMSERPLFSRHHQGLRQSEIHMHVHLPAHRHLPMDIFISVGPRHATKSNSGLAPPVLIGLELQLQKCLRMRCNSGTKDSGLIKRVLDTVTTVSATCIIPCYELLTEKPRRVVTDLESFDNMIQDSELAILTPLRTYTISHTYLLTVTAKLKGPGHGSREYVFSQDVPWRLYWAVAPMQRTSPATGQCYTITPGSEPQSLSKQPKPIVSPEAEVASGTKLSQAKTIEPTITALDSQDDNVSSATSSQLAFERGEEERRGLMPIHKAWWKKGIKMDDDFRHM